MPERTPRNRYIDTLRAAAIVRVVVYHAIGWAWLTVALPAPNPAAVDSISKATGFAVYPVFSNPADLEATRRRLTTNGSKTASADAPPRE